MRDKILAAAKGQILKLGLRKFTVEGIATELGISKKTIYKFFPSKKELIANVVDRVIEEEKSYTLSVMNMAANHITKMEAMLFFNACHGIPGWLIDELKHYYPTEFRKKEEIQRLKMAYFNQLFAEGVAAGLLRADVKTGMLDLIVRQTVEALLDKDFLESQELTVDEAIEQMKNILFYGITVQEAKG